MDSDEPSRTPRRRRFAPKSQRQRKTGATAVPKTANVDDDEDAQQQLLQGFNELESRRRQRPKVENQSSVQPSFVHRTRQSITIRASDVPRDGDPNENVELDLKLLDDSSGQSIISSTSTLPVERSSTDDSDMEIKEYREPWNYANTYYPTTLPWREPDSGNPDILDEAEFGEAARKVEYDENTMNSASELGLLNPDETSENSRLLFFQLPQSLPVTKRSATAKGKEIEGSLPPSNQRGPAALAQKGSSSGAGEGASQPPCSLEELSAGYMGKLLVYKSGAVKLKLGDSLFDVSSGSDCTFAEDVVVVNTKKKECCSIGTIDKRAIVTPDMNDLLNSVIDLG